MQHNHPSHTQNVAPFGVYLYVVKWVESVLAETFHTENNHKQLIVITLINKVILSQLYDLSRHQLSFTATGKQVVYNKMCFFTALLSRGET